MILNRQRAVRAARRPLAVFLRQVKHELGLDEASVTVCLVSDQEIARMNEEFRKKKGPTDVLSFPAVTRRSARLRRTSTTMKPGECLGDIAISPATARDRKSTRLNSSHTVISYAVFCLKKKNGDNRTTNVYRTRSGHGVEE